jgi:hypothetical protein
MAGHPFRTPANLASAIYLFDPYHGRENLLFPLKPFLKSGYYMVALLL